MQTKIVKTEEEIKMALTGAEKQARSRKNRKEAGLIRKEIWVKPEVWKKIEKIIKKGVDSDQ